MQTYNKGTKVKWRWGDGYGHGEVESSFTGPVTRTIAGEDITRNGSEDNPAYYVRVDDGNNVLKLHSELKQDE
jgi:hypothetical protein